MSESIWKKEIRLRRPKEAKVEVAHVQLTADKTSVWKKELHLRRQPEPLPPLPSRLLEQARSGAEPVRPERPRGTVIVPIVPASDDSMQRVERWTSRLPASHVTTEFPRPAAGEEQDPVALLPQERAAADPAPAVPLLPTPPAAYGWAKTQPEPEPESEPAQSEPVLAEPEPVAVEPEPVLAEPEPVAEVAPPAAEKVPLLKREISFGRKPKAKAEPKPKTPKQPKPAGEKIPLLKREISLKRTPKPKSGGGHKITHVVGLRVGSSQIAAAHVRNNGSAEVLQLARVGLEPGTVVAGEVRDQLALTKALKTFFADNKLPRKDIRLGISSNRIGVRVLEVPAVADAKQFRNAIRFRAQEILPISVADAVIDHVVLDESLAESGEVMCRVLVVFAHRELVSRYVDVCKQAGLRLAGIDLDAFALLRAVAPASDPEARRACVAVGIGHDRTVFAVSDGNACDFTRVLDWGGGTIDVAIARSLNLTPSQAQPIKRLLDLDASEAPADMSPMQFEAARAAAKTEIAQLVRELLSSLRFYQSREDSLDIGEIVLSGGGAELPGLAAEVQRGLGAPVRIADPFARAKLAKKVAVPADAGSLTIAVGLGIEG